MEGRERERAKKKMMIMAAFESHGFPWSESGDHLLRRRNKDLNAPSLPSFSILFRFKGNCSLKSGLFLFLLLLNRRRGGGLNPLQGATGYDASVTSAGFSHLKGRRHASFLPFLLLLLLLLLLLPSLILYLCFLLLSPSF